MVVLLLLHSLSSCMLLDLIHDETAVLLSASLNILTIGWYSMCGSVLSPPLPRLPSSRQVGQSAVLAGRNA